MNVIAGYDILEKIGEGGMGQVYRAVHRRLGRQVAIKRLAPQLSQNQDMLRRFLQEARLQASLPHPNVVSIFDLVENDEGVFLVMEYVEGQTAREMLQGRGRLTMTETLMIAEGVLNGLAFMHRNGVVHRDIKPSNIMVSVTGAVKVTDFGIARLVNEETGLTRFGGGIGTLHYMAPELIKSGEVSFAIDIYSLGATLYELLSGTPPFTGNTDLEIMMGHLEREAPQLDHLPETPTGQACRALLAKALAKDPADRHASAEAFLAEVHRARELLRAELPAAAPTQAEVPVAPAPEATPAGSAEAFTGVVQAPDTTAAGPSDATAPGLAPPPNIPPASQLSPAPPATDSGPAQAQPTAVALEPPVQPAPADSQAQASAVDSEPPAPQPEPEPAPAEIPAATGPGRRKLVIGLGALVALGLLLIVFLTGQHRETAPPAPVATAPAAPKPAPAATASQPAPAETAPTPAPETAGPAAPTPAAPSAAAGPTAPEPTPAAQSVPQQPAPAPAPAVEPAPAPVEAAATTAPEEAPQAAPPASPEKPAQEMAPAAQATTAQETTPRESAPAEPAQAESPREAAVAPPADTGNSPESAPPTSPTQRKSMVYSSVDARLREQPDISSDIIRTVDKGTRLEIQETRGEWLKVKAPEGQIGFIRADLTASRPPVAQPPTPAAHRPSKPTPRPKLPKSPDEGRSGWRIVK